MENLLVELEPYGIALHLPDGKIYWTDRAIGAIRRADLDGSHVQDLLGGLIEPGGLALDLTGDKLYWVDSGTATIQRAELDGSNVEELLAGLIDLVDIDVDASGGKIYWTGNHRLRRADLDGSNMETLFDGVFGTVTGVVLRLEADGPDSGDPVPAAGPRTAIVMALIVLFAATALLVRRRQAG